LGKIDDFVLMAKTYGKSFQNEQKKKSKNKQGKTTVLNDTSIKSWVFCRKKTSPLFSIANFC
jgi:hypothetical protein